MKKKNIAYATELHSIIDKLSTLVNDCLNEGFMPTFSVKAGVIGMVAVYYRNETKGTGKVGRPPKAETILSQE